MTEPRQRWVWAGIAVRDEEGNMIVLQMDNPQGSVESSQDFVPKRMMDGTRAYVPGPILLRVHLRGYAYEWSGDTDWTPHLSKTEIEVLRQQNLESRYRQIEGQ